MVKKQRRRKEGKRNKVLVEEQLCLITWGRTVDLNTSCKNPILENSKISLKF